MLASNTEAQIHKGKAFLDALSKNSESNAGKTVSKRDGLIATGTEVW